MAAVVSTGGGAGGGTGGARGIGAIVPAKHIGIKTLPRGSTPGLDSGFTSDASVRGNGTPKKGVVVEGGVGGLDRLSTLSLLDGAIAQARLGMENGKTEPMDKGEFVRSVLALVYVSWSPCLSARIFILIVCIAR